MTFIKIDYKVALLIVLFNHCAKLQNIKKPLCCSPKSIKKCWKNSVYEPKNGVLGQTTVKTGLFSKNCRFFEKFWALFENFRKILALMKSHRPKKNGPKGNKNENFGGWWNPTKGHTSPKKENVPTITKMLPSLGLQMQEHRNSVILQIRGLALSCSTNG